MSLYFKLFIVSVYMICFPCYAFGQISFDANGKWETTFDCPQQTQFQGSLNCQGMYWKGNWYFDNNRTQIISDANNPSGEGGRGARFWVGDGTNLNTATIGVNFPSAQPEIWIRYYLRYQSGFNWSSLNYDKHLYIYTASGGTQVIPGPTNGGRYYYGAVAQGTPNYFQVMTPYGYGFNYINGGSVGDGQFHCYEIYLKMDTNQTNGVGRIWIDGVLLAENTSVNWSAGTSASFPGWTNFHFYSNQASPIGGPYYVDIDDIVVYTQTPPNRDSHGNPFIGPLPLAPPESLSITVEPQ